MIDRRHACVECLVNADRNGHMSGERNAEFIGRIGNREELVRTESRVNIDKIVTCLVLRSDLTRSIRCPAHRITIH